MRRVNPIAFAREALSGAGAPRSEREEQRHQRQRAIDDAERQERPQERENLETDLADLGLHLQDWACEFSRLSGFPSGRIPPHLIHDALKQADPGIAHELDDIQTTVHQRVYRAIFDRRWQRQTGSDPLDGLCAVMHALAGRGAIDVCARLLGITRERFYRHRREGLIKMAVSFGAQY